jgi:hypothetical protein
MRLAVLRRSMAAGIALGVATFLALVLASPAPALTISGRVVKGTDRAPAAGVAVSLHVIRGDQELPGSTQQSDASGAYRFNGVTEGQGLEYYVSTEYEDAFYTEGPIPAHGGAAAAPDLVVYDVAKDFDAISVQDHHVIVERKEGGLHVTEILIFQNHANTAFLGVGVNHALASGMRVGLPSSVKQFKPGMGLDEQSVRLQGRELTSVRPIPPGQRPLSFTYMVPMSGRMDLSHRLYFPTRQMTVLVDDPSLRVESKQLKSAGIRDQGGKKYSMYFGQNLPVGSEVSVRIGGAGFFSNPRIYPFLAAPFVIAGVLWFAARRGKKGMRAKHPPVEPAAAPAGAAASARVSPAPGAPHAAPTAPRAAPAPSKNGDDLAETYLYLIAALDQGVERGDVSPESHALIRGNLKRRLEVILSDAPHAKAR